MSDWEFGVELGSNSLIVVGIKHLDIMFEWKVKRQYNGIEAF